MGLIVRQRRHLMVEHHPTKDPLDQLLKFLRRVGEETQPYIGHAGRRRRYVEAIERLARLLEEGIAPAADRARPVPFRNLHREEPNVAPNRAPFAHSRFYASLRPLRMACPRCDAIMLLAYGQSHYAKYNPVTGIVRCPQCEYVLQLGLIAWPVTNNRHRGAIDQQLTYRQIAEIRAMTGGFWAEEKKGQGQPVNLLAEPCRCESDRRPDPLCPVHGQPDEDPHEPEDPQ